MATNLEKVLRDVQALLPEDQQHVRQWLEEIQAATKPSEPATEGIFRQRLRHAGLLRTITPHGVEQEPSQRRKCVDIQGKPLSETVIEERR
jgi:hypothetical protein